MRNAVEAMGKRGGKINLRVTQAGATKASSRADLVIAVSDTGPGIPKEIESKLFQSFVSRRQKRGDGARARHREEDRRRAPGLDRGALHQPRHHLHFGFARGRL